MNRSWRRRRSRPNWPLRWTLLGIAAAAVLYVALGVWWQENRFWHPADLLLRGVADVAVALWFFAMGSAIGSFLNVVAYRLPRGRGVGGSSKCPYCAQRIASYHNVPVLGWLALRGRCAVCRMPISPRYPIVELAVGLTLAAIAWVELQRGGINLPLGSAALVGRSTGPWIWEPATIAMALYHVLAVAGAWALGLTRLDGVRLPARLVAVVLCGVIVPLLLWPPLQVVPWQVAVAEDWQPHSRLDGILRVITSLVAAALVARVLALYLCPGADPKLDPLGRQTGRLLDLITMLAVPALLVGWHALLAVVLLAVPLAAVLRGRFPRWDALGWLGVALPVFTTVQIIAWGPLQGLGFWPGPNRHPAVMLGGALLLLLVARVLREPVQSPGEGSGAGEKPEAPEESEEAGGTRRSAV